MIRSSADSFHLLQEHYKCARELDRDGQRDYIERLREAEPDIATRLSSMLDVSDDATDLALPRIAALEVLKALGAGDVGRDRGPRRHRLQRHGNGLPSSPGEAAT